METQAVVNTSRSNPGWQGVGTPGIEYFSGRVKSILSGLTTFKPGTGNLLLATLADFWNNWILPYKRANCVCCGWNGSSFLASANWRTVTFQSRCPHCDSRSRHRGLVRYLDLHASELNHRRTLLFAPEGIILKSLRRIGIDILQTTDFILADVDFPGEDIQKLTLENASFDLVLCNHVLEHVADDQSAIRECARILSSDGIALFTIPGDYDKAETWYFTSPDSNGHHRHYGLDVLTKFKNAFPFVEAVDMSTFGSREDHIRYRDLLFVCRKNSIA
ncbi:class I SAM-dependent methyltransferase [Sphingobacteriales bacterium CHB3]|nr:class I SAM-dependent methyltransferase [Sphingobacteriales bacterium CHB3]